MPGVAQPGQVGVPQDISGRIFYVDAEEIPVFASIKKGPGPTSEIFGYQVDAPTSVSKRGVADGTPLGVAKDHSKDRAMLETNSHWMREGVFVGKKATKIDAVKGIGKGRLLARETWKALRALRTGVDQVFCDLTDQRDEGPNGSETRGYGSWFATTAQGVRPVPTKYLTVSGNEYKGTWANLDERDIQGIVNSIFLFVGKATRLQGFFGIDLVQKVSNWSVWQPDVAGETAVRQFNAQQKGRVLRAIISLLEYPGGSIEIHPTRNLFRGRDAATNAVPANAQNRGGLIVDGNDLMAKFAENPVYEPLNYTGGGQSGQVSTITMTCAGDPRKGGTIQPT